MFPKIFDFIFVLSVSRSLSLDELENVLYDKSNKNFVSNANPYSCKLLIKPPKGNLIIERIAYGAILLLRNVQKLD